MRRNGYYGLRGSASPVLTATDLVNVKWQYSMPTESTPLNQSPKTLAQVITSAAPIRQCQIWCKYAHRKHLETYSFCCWLVLLHVSPQPIPQAHPVFRKRVGLLLQPRVFILRQPQTSLANSQQTPTPQILLTASHHLSWHFTCRQLCFFFQWQNIQTPPFSHQPPCHIISTLTLSSCHSP